MTWSELTIFQLLANEPALSELHIKCSRDNEPIPYILEEEENKYPNDLSLSPSALCVLRHFPPSVDTCRSKSSGDVTRRYRLTPLTHSWQTKNLCLLRKWPAVQRMAGWEERCPFSFLSGVCFISSRNKGLSLSARLHNIPDFSLSFFSSCPRHFSAHNW